MTNNKKESLVDLRRERGSGLESENFSSESDNKNSDNKNNESENVRVSVSKIKNSKLFKRFDKKERAEKENNKCGGGMEKFSGHLDGAIKKLLYLLVFLLPVFVLPFSTEIYEFNKTLLLFFISGLAFLLWLANMILVNRKIEIIRTPLDLPIVIFISLILVSTAFSVDKVSSVLGFYGRFSDSLLVYLSLAMVYFVGVNCLGRHSISAVVRTFLASSFIAVITSLVYSFGFKFIPWEEAGFRSFNLVGGSLNILGIYLTVVILIALGWRVAAANALSKHLMSALIVMSLVLLTLIDFILAWIVLAVCLILALILAGIKVGTRHRLVSTGLIFLISLAFIATSLTAVNNNIQSDLESSLISSSVKSRLISSDNNQAAKNDGFTREIILDKNTAVSIAMAGLENVKSDPISVIIGSGPGTYLYNFSKFKPAEFNGSVFWNLRFDKAGGEILEKVSTLGVLGTLSYLIIIILAMGMFLKGIFRVDGDEAIPRLHGAAIYLFAAWFGLLLFQFLYLESTAIKFIFWMLTIILAAGYCISRRARRLHSGDSPVESERESASGLHSPNGTMEPAFILNLKKEPSAFYSSLAALLVITAAFGYSCYHQLNFYQAEAIYKSARARQNEALRNPNLTPERAWEVLDQGVNDLKRAVAKNPQRGEYKIYLSDICLNRANLAFQEENKKSEEEKNTRRIAAEVKNTIDYAKGAADTSPNNIIFQQKLATVYAAMAKNMGVAGAGEWAAKSYQKAMELEPTNPVLRAELGKIYASAGKIDLAIGEFEKALELKNNYLDAGLQLGLAYEKRENNQKAIERLNSLGSVERIDDFIAAGQTIGLNSSSVDVDIAFQLGRIYYNEGEIGKAKNIFLKITKANPTYSNAHYSLGLIYEKEGNGEAALREFEIVLAANPGNEEVVGKVNELRDGGIKENKEIKEE